MKYWVRLLIALGLGAAAAGLNYTSLLAKTAPQKFVSISQDLKRGDHIKPEAVTSIELGGNLGSLPQVAIPFSRAAVTYQQQVTRDMRKGDIVFWRDIEPAPTVPALAAGEAGMEISLDRVKGYEPQLLKAGSQVGFVIRARAASPGGSSSSVAPADDHEQLDVIGPFRVVSVGARIEAYHSAGDSGHDSSRPIITVATNLRDQQLEESAQRLLKASIWDDGRSGSGIAAILLWSQANH